MILVTVQLISAITGETTEIARMTISNKGGAPNPRRGDYVGKTYLGRSREVLHRSMLRDNISRQADVDNHPRLQEPAKKA
jgi:hypothetical protein